MCIRCQDVGIHSPNVLLNRSGLILQKKIRKFAQNTYTNRQTDRQRIQLQRPLLSPVDRRGERANKVSISWKSVRRLKRKTKLFIFNDCVDGKAEISTVSQEDSQRMPVVLGGRRPMMLVPGIDYGLEEGEDVMVCPEEEREVRLATVEQYNIDSFCLEAGYLSLAEMAETPPVDNVVRKVKQKRRANGVKVRYYLGKFWVLVWLD